MNYKLNIPFIVLLSLIISSCKKDVSQLPGTDAASQSISNARATGTTSGDVYLTVSIEPLSNDGLTLNKMLSDGNPYTHTKDRVQAVIFNGGDFYFQSNTNANRDPLRKVFFKSDGDLPDAFMNNSKNISMRTGYSTAAINDGREPVLLQNMAAGDYQIMGFRIWSELSAGVYGWKLRYSYGEDAGTPGLDYVKVTRTTSGWIIEPALRSDPGATANLIDLTNQGNGGFKQIPFKLVLNKSK